MKLSRLISSEKGIETWTTPPPSYLTNMTATDFKLQPNAVLSNLHSLPFRNLSLPFHLSSSTNSISLCLLWKKSNPVKRCYFLCYKYGVFCVGLYVLKGQDWKFVCQRPGNVVGNYQPIKIVQPVDYGDRRRHVACPVLFWHVVHDSINFLTVQWIS